MTDIREAVMARLVAIAQVVDEIVFVDRNKVAFNDSVLPAIFVLEGDEEASDADPIKGPLSPRRIMMMPQLVIAAAAKPEELGADINTLRASTIKAVLMDESLAALTINKTGVRYIGMESDLALGRTLSGQMALKFAFHVLLNPADL